MRKPFAAVKRGLATKRRAAVMPLRTHGGPRLTASWLAALLLPCCWHPHSQSGPVPRAPREPRDDGRRHFYGVESTLPLPFGTPVTLTGELVPATGKGRALCLKVQRIDNVATQRRLTVELRSWGGGELSPELWSAGTAEVFGYESGGFRGMPERVLREMDAGLQVRVGHVFHPFFVVSRWRKVDPVAHSPRDFVGRHASFEGVAVTHQNGAAIKGAAWRLFVSGLTEWSDRHAGKVVQVTGRVDALLASGDFVASDMRCGLVRLEDQVGADVELEGFPRWAVGGWWLSYRGTDVYVQGVGEPPKPSRWRYDESIIVSGTLARELLPPPDRAVAKEGQQGDRTLRYVVKEATWETARGDSNGVVLHLPQAPGP